jgi:sucrose-6-phosphate hydrolase SacC (GH32 family)
MESLLKTMTMKLILNITIFIFICSLGNLVKAEGNKPPQHIGEFSRNGEYIKDYYVYLEGNTFHLFYNVGDAGPIQDWQDPKNEKSFGHATSTDLKNWTYHPRVLHVIPNSWEGQVVSAPSILKNKDTYYMVYTGFDDRVLGKQSIGLATSKDLYNWKRYEGNPVFTAPDWTMRNANGWLDCRDAHIIRYKNENLLFAMTTTKEGKGAIALASSKDAKHWKDLGPALISFSQPESPRVFEHNGMYYMFATSGLGKILCKAKDPKANKWTEIPFVWPTGGLWSGWEVVQDKDRTIFSAFLWKTNGNFIRFWEIDWDGETPVVRY